MTAPALNTNRAIVVSIADFRVSANPEDVIITYALGSCLGITVYDPVARVGGMLHVQLPQSSISPEKRQNAPATFVDTGVPMLFKAAYAAGAQKSRLIVKVAGGASTSAGESDDRFQIGKRNILALRQLLWKNGVMIEAEDVGGVNNARTVSLELQTGLVSLRSQGVTRCL